MVLKELILTVSTLGGCGGLERTDFYQFLHLGGCGGIERTDFYQFPLWEGVVVLTELIFKFLIWVGVAVLKELIVNSFYFGWV